VAAWITADTIIEVRYILQMVGVPINGPALLLGDNSSVVLNTSVPSLVLKKKHHACAYHWVQEAIAGNIICFAHIPGTTNYAEVLPEQASIKRCFPQSCQTFAFPCAKGWAGDNYLLRSLPSWIPFLVTNIFRVTLWEWVSSL
jgi:hypothetical protein